jgi:hypothetical protein
MDGTRPRRTLDRARRDWYSHWRSVRFARHLGFLAPFSLLAAGRPRATSRKSA